jgi:DNA-binding CsgD family transcriptional regulator/tetratricopeptide (TPR) repeat protein
MPASPKPRDTGAGSLLRARSAMNRRAWREAYDAYAAADLERTLEASDLERFAEAAQLTGRPAEREAIGVRAHQVHLDRGDVEGAARAAFWLGFGLMVAGDGARASGWLARAQRILDDANCDCVVRGYLLVPQGMRLTGPSPAAALATFERVLECGRRFNDKSLVTYGRLGIGRSLVRLDRIPEGVALMDEVMVAVTAGEVEHITAGAIYCAVIDACHEIFDMRRAQEWTDALSAWCAAQPDLVAFQGACLLNRASILQLTGAWAAALDEARRACEWLADPPGQPAAGGAHYRAGELHRIRGDFDAAESEYRVAHEHGREPHPGLALIWSAKGRTDDAAKTIRRLLGERQDIRRRVQVLDASVEILLAAGDVETARTAADELTRFATGVGAPYLMASAARGRGAVSLAASDARAALIDFEEALDGWRALGAPYEGARTRVMIALAHRALGDESSATLELDAARRTFAELGAAWDLARAATLSKATSGRSGDLTDREIEVLSLVAGGKTNRAIATSLGISEKTVARHVSNIFTKLDLPNRAAATAYAYEHKLLK